MSPMNIKPINTLLQTRSGILSNYAQRYIKPQVKSTSYAFERFFTETDSNLISQNEQKLKEIGFRHIGKDSKEGVVISDYEYDYRVFSVDDGFLGFDVLESGSDKICRHFSVNEKNNEYRRSGNFSGLSLEDEMEKVLDFISDKLFEAKRECKPDKIPQPFLPKQTTSEKIAEVNKVLRTTPKNKDVKNAGIIGSNEKELIESIDEKLKVTQELYKKIKDCRTKWEVKKSYPNYLAQPVANKIGFKDIGPNGESISLFNTSYRNNAHTALIVTDTSGQELKFVISKDDGSVRRNFPSRLVKSGDHDYRIHLTPDYYTQQELEGLDLPVYLSCFNKEMDNFIGHTKGWFDKKEEIKLIKSNYDSATLEPYKELLDDIHTNFENYRTKMRKFMRKPHKNKKFKAENNISTKLTSTAVKFDKITPEGYDLRLSYPKIHDKTATQLLVMKDDKVENSFFILDNKLLRFKIRDLNDKVTHYNRKEYYYDNKYLQESNLPDYMILLRDKLHELNKKLDIIRKKQIKNRERYHIKTKEGQS